MPASVVIPVGYDLRRHVDGIRSILKIGVESIYILQDAFNPGYTDISKKNAARLADELKLLNPQIRGFNPQDPLSVIKELSYIKELENEMGRKADLYVDITSTARDVFIVSSCFASLFGVRIYFVPPTHHFPVTVQSKYALLELSKDTQVIEFFRNIILRSDEKTEEKLAGFLSFIAGRYPSTVMDRIAERGGKEASVFDMAHGNIDLTEMDKHILLALGKKGEFPSIKALAEDLGYNDRNSRAMVAYRVRRLNEWRFIEKSGRRKIRLSLTSFGRGYSQGIREARLRTGKMTA